MALKEYIGLSRLTQAFSLLKSKIDGKEDTPRVISYADFMELTPQQQTSGYYLVVGGTPITNAYGISYQPNKTVGDALDDHADAIDELNADKADKDLSNVTGTLDASHGGTGQTSLQATRNAMGLGNTTGALPVANGGTGSTTAANARSALGLGDLSTKSLKQASFSTTSDANGNILLVSGYRKIILVTCTQARAFAWCSDTGGQQNTYISFYEFTTNTMYGSRPVNGAYWYIE